MDTCGLERVERFRINLNEKNFASQKNTLTSSLPSENGHARYLDMDRLAEASEAVWSSVGAAAARATICSDRRRGGGQSSHHPAGARPSTKVRKIPDTTNEYGKSPGIFCLSY
jgi:hypothetical protein